MEFLTRMEEIILLTVHRLAPEAYGVTIRAAVEELLGKPISVGAVYVPLDRLAERGYLETSYSDPTPERGGRRKIGRHGMADDLTPILIGAGQITQREADPQAALSPLDLTAAAAKAAADDAGGGQRLIEALDTIVAIRSFSDTCWRFASPFGGSSSASS